MTGSVVRLKGLQIFKSTKNGKIYAYHRASGRRLTGEIGSAEFLKQYSDAVASLSAKQEKPASLGQAIREYRATEYFRDDLADVTRDEYNRYLKQLEKSADMPLAEVTPMFIARLRNTYSEDHGFRAANMMLTVLRLVLAIAKENGHVMENHANDIANARRPKRLGKPNRPWTPEELRVVMDAAPPHLRIVIALCRATGFRIGDAICLPRSVIKNGWIQWETRKRGVWATLPIRGWLADELERAPKHDAITICATTDGTPWASSDSVGCVIRRLFGALVAEGKVGKGLTIHGLRHTVGFDLAEAGCTDDEIAAWLAHTSTATAKIYTEGAKRKRSVESAMLRLEGKK